MKLTPAHKLPRLVAVLYAIMGLIFFVLTLFDKTEERDYSWPIATLENSYPCANYTHWCPLDIGFKTAILIEDNTPLGSYIEKRVDPVDYLDKHPFLNFWFTKIYSGMAPWYWLFKILYGCLFYYLLTWLLVKVVSFLRKRRTP